MSGRARALAGEAHFTHALADSICEGGAIEQRLWPTLSASVQDLLRLQMRFMVEHGYLSADVRLDGWVDDSFLKEAYRRENRSWAA